MIELTVAELADVTELDLGATPWRRVDQAMVDTFADATGAIADGYLALSLVPAMLKDLLRIKDHARGTNYGLEKVRFTAPVPAGGEIRLAATILDAVWRPDGGVQYHVALLVEICGQERPAMIAESIYLTYPG
jgi:acyl dehydratase